MQGNYDRVASYYDVLSQLFFGKAIYNAHHFAIESITAKSSILIVGGGTGTILEQLARADASELTIYYVELSSRMIAKARKRNWGGNKVFFINQPIQAFKTAKDFDVIITPFLFDNFAEETAGQVFHQLDKQLVSGGHWIFIDFNENNKNYLFKVLLKAMYSFFKLACNIEADHLPAIKKSFDRSGYTVVAEKAFYNDFIGSTVYKKRN